MTNREYVEHQVRTSAQAAGVGDEQIEQLVKAFMSKLPTPSPKPLTDIQQRVFDYLIEGHEITSLRQLARDIGFDHPTKLTSVLAALTVKGYLVPRGKK